MFEPTPLQISVLGVVIPWVVQFIRNKWLPWNNKAAMWLSALVAALICSGVYFFTDKTPTYQEFLHALAGMFALSQLVYRQLSEKLKKSEDTEVSGEA